VKRVLTALDGRRASEAALPAIVGMARDSGVRVYLLRVVEAPAPTAGGAVRHGAAVQKAQRYLAETRERLVRGGIRDVSTAVWAGSAAAAIVKAAESIKADVIVMARSGRTGSPRSVVGSVVERVLRGTKRPVLVIAPPDAVVETPAGDAAPHVVPRVTPSGTPSLRSRPGRGPGRESRPSSWGWSSVRR
jgi:nucleotide-binding universal stress UspA family protein